MNYRLFSLFLFSISLLCGAAQALAGQTLQLSDAQTKYALGPWLEILEDPGGALTIDEVSREPFASRFTPSQQAIPNFGFTPSAFWIRLRLQNSTASTRQWLLEQHFANTHTLDLYRPAPSGQGFIKHASGNLRPFDSRDIPHQRIIFKLPLPAGAEQTIYLRLQSGASSTIDLNLWQTEAFASADRREAFWMGLFYGMLVVFLVYNLLMWVILREASYLWLTLFVAAILTTLSFYDGYAQQLIDAADMGWSRYAIPLSMTLTIIAMLVFIRRFLPPTRPDSLRARLHTIHIALWIIILILMPVTPYVLLMKIIVPTSMACVLYVLAWAVIAWREGQLSARLFLSGWSVFLLGILLTLSVRIGWLEPNLLSENHPARIGLIWLVLFTALAQASRVHHLRRESERTSEALRQSESQRQLAMRIGRIGTWSFDPASQHINYSPEAEALIKLTDARLSGDFDSDYDTLHRHIHNDDWPDLVSRTKTSLRDNIPLCAEFRITHNHEKAHWLEIYGEMHHDEAHHSHILSGTLQDISERKQREAEARQSEETLKGIASAVSAHTGEAFFRELVLSIAQLFDVDHVLIGISDEHNTQHIRTIALCMHGKIRENISYLPINGPCEAVINGEFRSNHCGAREQFPDSEILPKLDADSYIGAPLLAYYGKPLGIISVLNTGRINNGARIQSILRIFAVRASAELLRLKTEQQLHAAKQRLEQHVQNTPVAVIEFNAQREITAWNPAAGHIFGFTEKEALGRTPDGLILPAEMGPILEGVWSDLMAQSGGSHSTNENLTKDGRTITCEWYNTPLFGDNGEVIGVASLVSDVSEQVNAQAELTRHRDHLEELVSQRSAEVRDQARIIDQIHDSVVATDMQGNVIYWNLGATRRLGYTREEALGRFISFIHAQTEPVTLEQIISNLQKNGQLEKELQIQCKDGTQFSAHLSLSMRYDSDEQPCGMIGIILDISERKQAETELEKQRLALKNTNRELEAFSYSVSHDLRAPLRALNGFSQALLEDYASQLDDTARDYIQRLRSATLRMSERIDSLLVLSRLSRSTMQRETIDLSDMAQDIIQQLEENEPERRVEWDIQPNIRASADAPLLNAVLDNLLGNAWKYTARTTEAKVHFETRQMKQGLAYIVSDNGAGFDMRHASKLFAPFQRLHNETDFPGSGVGLATVARIIHRHGGEVWAQAEINKGASFYFTLP